MLWNWAGFYYVSFDCFQLGFRIKYLFHCTRSRWLELHFCSKVMTLLYLSVHRCKDPFVEHPVCGCEGPSSSNLNSNDSFLRATAVFIFCQIRFVAVAILLVSVLLRVVSNNQMNLSAGNKKSQFIQNKLQWRFIWRFLTCFFLFLSIITYINTNNSNY